MICPVFILQKKKEKWERKNNIVTKNTVTVVRTDGARAFIDKLLK